MPFLNTFQKYIFEIGVSCYLKINGTCGKSSFCGKIFVPLFFLLFFCFVNIPLLASDDFYDEDSAAMLLSRITFIIALLLLMILYIITPKKIAGQKDGFFIVSEITIIFAFNIAMFCVAIFGAIYGRYVYEPREDQRRYVYLLVEESLYFGFEWLIVMFSTFYVLGKTGEILAKYTLQTKNKRHENIKMIRMDQNVSTQLYQALQSVAVFNSFLNFLAAEHNVKCPIEC